MSDPLLMDGIDSVAPPSALAASSSDSSTTTSISHRPEHTRTLTSLLAHTSSNPPSELSVSTDLIERSHSVPGEMGGSVKSQPMIVSQPLESTHQQEMLQPAIIHATSDPTQQMHTLDKQELKAFDPLANLSPPPPSAVNTSPRNDDTMHQQVHPPPNLTDLTTPRNNAMPSTSTAALSTPASTLLTIPTPSATSATSLISLGPDQAISSVNSYSSAALSSGSFTAISVSPVPTPGEFTHMPITPTNQPVLPSVTTPLAAAAPASSASASTAAISTPEQDHLGVRTLNPDSTSRALFPSPTTAPSTISQLTIATSSAPSSSDQPPLSSGSTRLGVRFVETEQGAESVSTFTPSMVRVHEEEMSPTYPNVQNSTDNNTQSTTSGSTISSASSSTAVSSILASSSSGSTAIPSVLSPSFPFLNTSASPTDGDHSTHPDSPLPPVVSALMAAQKVSGTTPGATLAVPTTSGSGRLIFVCGDASGAGKSCIALGLLHLLLKRGYQPSELAYIKPCTQCEDIQLVSKYCEKMGIEHQGLGPVIFYEGFTADVIDGKTESVDKRRGRIQKAVNKIAEGKKWVIVDGVGYAAVGSVAGVSNGEVASLLNAPVLVVGRPGVGNAIDSMNFMLAYFDKYHVHALGACWNRIPKMSTYHTYEKCKVYVEKYFREVRNGIISTYGHIPLIEKKVDPNTAASSSSTVAAPAAVACRLRAAKTELVMNAEDEEFLQEFLPLMEREFDIESFLGDLNRYYGRARVQLVSVV